MNNEKLQRKIYTRMDKYNTRWYAVECENISCTCHHCDTYQHCSDGHKFVVSTNLDIISCINAYESCSCGGSFSFVQNGVQMNAISENDLYQYISGYDEDIDETTTEEELYASENWTVLE